MLNLKDILSEYPLKVRSFKENILKEYLQYKILDFIYSSPLSGKLVFMGGTAIRIIHGSGRFSEDLDFDNFHISADDFAELSRVIDRGLQLEGYRIEIEEIYKNAFHCYIKFPKLLYEYGLSGYETQKILIQIDTEPQNFKYAPEKYMLNKFGIFRVINTVPVSLLLSQKIFACMNRKVPKGRDFFDVVFLSSKTEPNYEYLDKHMRVDSSEKLLKLLIKHSKTLNFQKLAKDVEPFLFERSQVERVERFLEWLETKPFFAKTNS